MVLLCVMHLTGCATWMDATDEPSPEQSAAQQASKSVATAQKHARFSLIAAYERRGMNEAASSVRESLARDPELKQAVLRSRVEGLMDGPKTIDAYERLSRLRDEHPELLSTDAYVDFLGEFIVAMNHSPARLAAMNELAAIRPKHPALVPEHFHEERIAAARRYMMSKRYEDAREVLAPVEAAIESEGASLSDDLVQSARLVDAKLAVETREPGQIKSALTQYLMVRSPTASKYSVALELLSKHKLGDVGLEWLEEVEPKLDRAGIVSQDMHLRRARFRANHGASPTDVRDDLRLGTDDSTDERLLLRAYRILDDMGHPKLGDEFLERVSSEAPGIDTAARIFAEYADRGMTEEAMGVADEFVQRVGDASAYARVASWMEKAGWTNRSVEWTRKAVARAPSRWIHATQLYRRASDIGHSTYAREAADRLENLAGEHGGRLRTLSAEFERQGQLQRAADMLWKAFENDSYVTNVGKIAELEARLGHPERAVEVYQKTLKRPYVSAAQWQMAGHQLERLVGLERALPFFEEAAERGGSTHLAVYISALHRAGEHEEVQHRISGFLAENAASATSIEVLASRLRLDRLPGPARAQILEAYAETGGRNARLARALLDMYAQNDRWDAALTYLEKRYLKRPHELTARPTRRGLGRYRDAVVDTEILGGVLAELEEESPPASDWSTNELRFAAALHTAYVRQIDARGRSETESSLDSAVRSSSAARSYYSRLVQRLRSRRQLDARLLEDLTKAGYHDVAEQYLLDMRDSTEPRVFWRHYTSILESAGRYRAAAHVARRRYELLEPRLRAGFAIETAERAAAAGELASAEYFLRAAIRAAEHPDTPQSMRVRVNRDGRAGLGHLLMQQGRGQAFIERTADYRERYAPGGKLTIEPQDATDLRVLWDYGYYDEYIERVERIAALESGPPAWTLSLAEAYLQRDQFDEAMKLLPDLSDDSARLHQFALELTRQNQPERALEAIAAYDSPLDPDPPRMILLRVELFLRMGQTTDAAEALVALDSDPRRGFGTRRLRPGQWSRLRSTLQRTGLQDAFARELERTGSPQSEEFIDTLDLAGENRLASAVDLSDFELTDLADNGAVTTNHVWDALQYGLDWPVAQHVIQSSGAPTSSGAHQRKPYLSIRDAIIRLGHLQEFTDQLNAAGARQSHGDALAYVQFNVLDARHDQLRSYLQTGKPHPGAWVAAMLVGDAASASSLHAQTYPRRSSSASALTRFADFQLYAAITGQRPTARMPAEDTGMADQLAQAALAFDRAEHISNGEIASALGEARDLLAVPERAGPHRSRDADRALTTLSVAAVMGYAPEARALLASVDGESASLELAHKRLVLGDVGELQDVAGDLPRGVLGDFVRLMTLREHHDAARALLDGGGAPPFQPSRGEFTGALLDIAIERGEEHKLDRYQDAAMFGVSTKRLNLRTARQIALQTGDFDALAQLEAIGGVLGTQNQWRQADMLVSNLNATELLRRLDRRISPAKNSDKFVRHISPARKRGNVIAGGPLLWPPIGAVEHHRRELEARVEAYPADPAPAVSLLVLELVNAPEEHGRARLDTYVEQFGDDDIRVRRLVEALLEHELFAELAKFVTPGVDLESMPVLTNLGLFSAAVRTGRPDQARQLGELVIARLPTPTYVASMLANEATSFGQLELAAHLLERVEGAEDIPYGALARARLDLLGDAPERGAAAIHAVLDASALAPTDHCRVLVDAMAAGPDALQERLLKRYMLLPPYLTTRISQELMSRVSNCFIDAGVAEHGLALLESVYPELTNASALTINPSVSVQLARLHRHAGDFAVADDYAEGAELSLQLLADEDVPARVWRVRARTSLAVGRLHDAHRFARRATEVTGDADLAEALVVLADVSAAKGQHDRAAAYLRYAHGLHPNTRWRNRLRIRMMRLPGGL
ncbi:MAG: hypothetical protein ACQEVA_07315 [Myxococcota bacterium]